MRAKRCWRATSRRCVAHDFLKQDPWLWTAAWFHHHGNVNAPIEQGTFKSRKRHAHAWRSFLKCRQRAGEFPGRRRRNRRGVHRSRRGRGHERPSKLARRGKHGNGFIGKEFSGLGEFDPPCAALKQFHAKLLRDLDLPINAGCATCSLLAASVTLRSSATAAK